MSGVFGDENYYRVFRFGEQDAEAETFQQETGWNRIWCPKGECVREDSWLVYRDYRILPIKLKDYGQIAERFPGDLQYHSFPEFGLRGTCAWIFYQARAGEVLRRDAFEKIQDFFKCFADLHNISFHLDLIKECQFGKKEDFRDMLHLPYLKLHFYEEYIEGKFLATYSFPTNKNNCVFSISQSEDGIVFSVKDKLNGECVEKVVPLGAFLEMSREDVLGVQEALIGDIDKAFSEKPLTEKISDAVVRAGSGAGEQNRVHSAERMVHSYGVFEFSEFEN